MTTSSNYECFFLTHLVHVNANSSAFQPDLLRSKKDVESRAAAEVNHSLALRSKCLSLRLYELSIDGACLSKTSYCKGIATAEPEVGVARDAVELLFGVAKCLCYGARMGRLFGSSEGAVVVLDLRVDGVGVHGVEGIEVMMGECEGW